VSWSYHSYPKRVRHNRSQYLDGSIPRRTRSSCLLVDPPTPPACHCLCAGCHTLTSSCFPTPPMTLSRQTRRVRACNTSMTAIDFDCVSTGWVNWATAFVTENILYCAYSLTIVFGEPRDCRHNTIHVHYFLYV